MVGPYRLARRLGEGGQGTVYLGRDDAGEPVAVKVLHVADERSRRALAKELAAARQVDAFCTARIVDADLSGEPPYIASEYIEGPSLKQMVEEGRPRSGADLHRLAVGTAAALTAIHQAGVVHLDFKPANVIMGPDGPRVIDFGVALRTDVLATAPGAQAGTPAFMAPEILNGAQAEPPADVFAWAGTMLFAATGRAPFGSDNLMAVMHRILTEEPDVSVLEEPLRGLVAGCLAKEPGERPTARQVLLRLLGHDDEPPLPRILQEAGALTGSADVRTRTDSTRPGGDPVAVRPRRGPRPALVSAATAITVVAALGLAYGVWSHITDGDHPGSLATGAPALAVTAPAPASPTPAPTPSRTPSRKPSPDSRPSSPKAAPDPSVHWFQGRLGLKLRAEWKVVETPSWGVHVLTDAPCAKPLASFLESRCNGFWVMGAEEINRGDEGFRTYTGRDRYHPSSGGARCPQPATGFQVASKKPPIRIKRPVGTETAQYTEWTVDCTSADGTEVVNSFTQREWYIADKQILVIDSLGISGLATALDQATWK